MPAQGIEARAQISRLSGGCTLQRDLGAHTRSGLPTPAYWQWFQSTSFRNMHAVFGVARQFQGAPP